MQFQFPIIQPNGEALGSMDVRPEAFAAVEPTRGVLVLACRTTQEILPKLILAQLRVCIELPGYPGLVVQWEQPDPFTASVLLLSGETAVAQSWFLSGCVAMTDAVQVDRIIDYLQALRPGDGERVSRALQMVTKRPVVIHLPLSPYLGRTLGDIGELIACLAVSYFAVAARLADEIVVPARNDFGVRSATSRSSR